MRPLQIAYPDLMAYKPAPAKTTRLRASDLDQVVIWPMAHQLTRTDARRIAVQEQLLDARALARCFDIELAVNT